MFCNLIVLLYVERLYSDTFKTQTFVNTKKFLILFKTVVYNYNKVTKVLRREPYCSTQFFNWRAKEGGAKSRGVFSSRFFMDRLAPCCTNKPASSALSSSQQRWLSTRKHYTMGNVRIKLTSEQASEILTGECCHMHLCNPQRFGFHMPTILSQHLCFHEMQPYVVEWLLAYR